MSSSPPAPAARPSRSRRRRAPFSLKAELARLDSTQREVAEAKLETLRQQLLVTGWTGEQVHDGSRFAWLYATDVNDQLDVEDVAQELSTMHFIHNSTSYPHIIEDRLRAAANLLHENYPALPWDRLWKLVVRFGVPIVKYSAGLEAISAQMGEQTTVETMATDPPDEPEHQEEDPSPDEPSQEEPQPDEPQSFQRESGSP